MAKATAPESKKPKYVGSVEAEIRSAINEFAQKLRDVGPDGYDIDKLATMAYYEVRNGRDLYRCTLSSFLSALYHCAQVGLYPGDRGHCYLIARKLKGIYNVQYQTGYQGYLELARRSGEIEKVEARIVYEADEFDWDYGTESYVKHKPSHTPDPTKLKACYAIAWLVDVTKPQFEVVLPHEIEKIKREVRPQEWSPWVKHEAAMWKKTACIRLCNLLPASTELSYAVARDKEAEAGIDQPDVSDEPTSGQTTDNVEDILGGATRQQPEPAANGN